MPRAARFHIGLLRLLPVLLAATGAQAVDYFEGFDNGGQPGGPPGSTWSFHREIHPAQGTWADFVPGDGFAHVTVDPDTGNDLDATNPFQYVAFGLAGPSHRLEARMQGAVVPGLAGFLFTYWEDSTFDEIDIELVADDAQAPPVGHPVDPPDGWSDARFNTWGNSSTTTFLPETSHKQPIVDESGAPVSHLDGQFHVYTIDWFPAEVRFTIDGVLQDVISYPVADSASEVLLGFRDLSWAGAFNWTGTRTLLIDWFNVQPIDASSPVAVVDRYSTMRDTALETTAAEGALANDQGAGLTAVLVSDVQHGTLALAAEGSFSYSPDVGFAGLDQFVYRADDLSAAGESNASPVWLLVEDPAANSAPAGVADSYAAAAGTALTVGPEGVVGNDTDPDGDLLSALLDSDVAHGTLMLETSGGFVYTPDDGFEGLDSFTYRAHDGQATSGPVTVTIRVEEGLFTYWPADEGSGVTAADAIGPNDGTLQGAAWAAGVLGQGLLLDGIDDYVQVGASDFVGPWTAAMWARRDASAACGTLLGSAAGALRIAQFSPTYRVGFSSFGAVDYTFDYTAPPGEWVHLTFVRTGNATALYANCAPVDSVPATISLPLGRLGRSTDGACAMKGALDDIQLYGRALDAVEIGGLCGPGCANRLVNPGLEAGELAPWTASNAGTAVEAHSGSWSARLGTGTSASGRITQVVTGLRPGTAYRLGAWLKSNNEGDAWIRVSNYGGALADDYHYSTTTWGQAELQFTTGATNTSAQVECYAEPYSWAYSSSVVFCDDIELAPADCCQSAAACADGLFCNGAETCTVFGCTAGTDPCPGQLCDEAGATCLACPTEDVQLMLAKLGSDGAHLDWTVAAAADSYALTRGDLGSLAPGQYGSCLATALSAPGYDDLDPAAASGGYAYLVRADSNACGPGSLGQTSEGVERANNDPQACP